MKDLPITIDEPMNWINKTGGYAKDMTLRDYFAAKAMQAMLSDDPDYHQKYRFIDLADFSYQCADAMLEAGK
jgi:hypothetical protein